MSTPLVPTIPSAKATLSAADTTTILNAIFGISPLPDTKTAQNARQIIIDLTQANPPTAGMTTSRLTVNFL